MTISPALQASILLALRYAMALVALRALAAYLGRERLLSIWSSEGELSLRLILATIIAAFALCMRAAGRLNTPEATSFLEIGLGLHALGTFKVAATRFAQRPQAPATQIKADTAPVTTENATITTPANEPASPQA